MLTCKKISIIIFLFMICMYTQKAEANYIVCPINCEQERNLYYTTPNMTGDDVQELQVQLKHLGYYQGKINGIYDTITMEAVKKVQVAHGVKPDGIVNVTTWSLLNANRGQPVSQEKIPPPPGKVSIVIDTVNRTLTIFSDNEPYRQFHVAVGKPETPSPIGNWVVLRKAMNWGTGFGTRWHGLNVPWGIYGIHGTNKPYSIGGYESHGCIRMHNSNVELIYPIIPVGTPVYIIGNPLGVPGHTHRLLRRGERGSDVAEVQRILKKRGYYTGNIDGIFGWGMTEGVKKLRLDHGLSPDDCVDLDTYKALGL